MYIPPAFAEDRPEELHEIMQTASLPVLISNINHPQQGKKLFATHLPLMHDGDRLIGHFAKANEHWRYADTAADSLAVFTAVDGYVSPSWYATKAGTGRVVPTWNYEAVHVYGRLEIFEKPNDILEIVTRLTTRYEASQPKPWQVTDAPADYIAAQLKGIVGVVLHISKIEGKRKLSQNKSSADQAGVVSGCAQENPELSKAMKAVLQP